MNIIKSYLDVSVNLNVSQKRSYKVAHKSTKISKCQVKTFTL